MRQSYGRDIVPTRENPPLHFAANARAQAAGSAIGPGLKAIDRARARPRAEPPS
jgi:hypothetical protein